MIKILKFHQIMQDEVKQFILENMNQELKTVDKESFVKITKDLEDIEKNYIATGGVVLLAYDTENKKIVGTIAIKIENGIAVLKRFYVDKNYRSKKIGYALYTNLEGQIKKIHVNQIYLTTGKELKTAHQFYEKNGWKLAKENPGIFVRKGADLYQKQFH